MGGEVVAENAVVAYGRLGDQVFLGAVAVGDVAGDEAAALRAVVPVERLFAARLDDVQVDVRVVRVPRDHDAQVGLERLAELGVERRHGRLRAFYPLRRLDPGDERVELLQREEPERVGMARPGREGHFDVQRHRLLELRGVAIGLAPFGERQGEVAVRLRILAAELDDAAELPDRQLVLPSLPQPPGEHAQQRGVPDLQLGEVRQDLRAQRRLLAAEAVVGAVEIERGTAPERALLLQVGLVQTARIRLLQRFEVRRLRIPGLDFDRGDRARPFFARHPLCARRPRRDRNLVRIRFERSRRPIVSLHCRRGRFGNGSHRPALRGPSEPKSGQ